MRITVTDASGFLGRHVLAALAKRGIQTLATSRSGDIGHARPGQRSVARSIATRRRQIRLRPSGARTPLSTLLGAGCRTIAASIILRASYRHNTDLLHPSCVTAFADSSLQAPALSPHFPSKSLILLA